MKAPAAALALGLLISGNTFAAEPKADECAALRAAMLNQAETVLKLLAVQLTAQRESIGRIELGKPVPEPGRVEKELTAAAKHYDSKAVVSGIVALDRLCPKK